MFTIFALVSMFGVWPWTPTTAQEQTPIFRSAATIVPLDVRVLDRQGRPVTDLLKSDFTIREDGVLQTVAYFAADELAPDQGESVLLRHKSVPSMNSPRRRVILIVLGRGILEQPFGAITAVIEFVRARLLPQDFVAVTAWNRATEFTTHHGRIVSVLERFKREHQDIELRLRTALAGLSALYGNRRIPRSIQIDIDRVFATAADRDGVRQVQNDPAQMDEQVRRDIWRELDKRLGADPHAIANPEFDKFLAWITPTMHDAGNLQAAVEYLRFLEGEKRIVFVTEEGFALPRTESDLRIAQAASEARVVIDTIHTSGTVAQPAGRSGLDDETFRRMSAMMTLRLLSQNTGGQRFGTLRPAAALERIDQTSRFGYLLGYYPTKLKTDSAFRRIDVTVNRPEVTVLVRAGYFATEKRAEFDQIRIMAETRIATAAAISQRISDININGKVAPLRRVEGRQLITVSGRFAARRLGWRRSPDDHYRIAVDVVIGCLDGRGILVGEHREHLVLTMDKTAYEKAITAGINFSLDVPVTGNPREVKVIVYDAAMDLIGSDIVTVGR